ncbi:MAG: hypothetical protein ACREA9_18015 [Pyrinomonadaceae bacterium]
MAIARSLSDITPGPAAFVYFVLVGALALGEGDAAGEGLAAGPGLVAGGAAVSLAGDGVGDDVAGDDVVLPGEGELVAGSVAQPAAKAIARIVVSRSVVQRVSFIFGLLISFASFEQD